MLIDCHAHTTNSKLWDLHTDSASIDKLEDYAKRFDIQKIILMATYFPFKKSGQHNDKLIKKIKNKPLFSMCASLDLSSENINWLKFEKVLNNPQVVGIKLYPGYQPVSLQDPKVVKICEIACRYSLPVVIHSGELHHCCSKELRQQGKRKCQLPSCAIDELQELSRPREVLVIAKKFPKVNFVLAHLGNPYFSELRDVMRQYSNVYTDISGQFISGTEEDSLEYRERLMIEIVKFLSLPQGSDRLLFGTDFPIQSYEDSLALINALYISIKVREKILFQNAKKLFALE